jgi:2-polyprenyl-6-methoxyphenol hydroxylase-like FAD-dependent oxidoreductase
MRVAVIGASLAGLFAAAAAAANGADTVILERDRLPETPELVIEGGYGHHRPTREPAEFEAYLVALRDPAVADVAARLEPVGDIALYRQTSNRRHRFGRVRGWPDGLLVVGDAACAFNPVYGQGITVAAQQALLIRDGWRARRLQRGLDGVADICWSVASGEDLRHPTSDGRQNLGQRVLARWSMELGHQAVAGDQRAYRTRWRR